MKDWSFREPHNPPAICSRYAIEGKKPILRASHDEEGDWCLLDGGAFSPERAMVVSH
jgi:hypothetical protein